MSIHYLYRIYGGQVLGMSIEAYEHSTYFANVTDPLEPNGRDLQPPKIHISGTVRNATAPEIANFAVAEAEDQNLIDRELAKAVYDQAVTKKAFRSFLSVLIDEINALRQVQKPPLKPDRTVGLVVAAIKSQIDAGDHD